VVTNVDKVVFTGEKWRQKLYRWHTGYPGGLKEVPAWRMRERRPDSVLAKAVSGMLPKNRLRDPRLGRLKLFYGDVCEQRVQS
jgi:large subunit ribosomal protein L13